MRVTEQQIQTFLEDGFVLVPGFLTAEELAQSTSDIEAWFPSGKAVAADPQRYRDLKTWVNFPYPSQTLNRQATHPEILAVVERVIGTPAIRAGHLKFQAKYFGPDPNDRVLHVDGWGENTIVYPRSDGVYRQLLFVLYYTDITEELGPTHIVKRRHTRHRDLSIPWFIRDDEPEIYRHIEPVLAPGGSLAILDMQTFHSGSAIRAVEGHRYVQYLTYSAACCPWLQVQQFLTTNQVVPVDFRRYIEAATPRQRQLFGFPPVGDGYWNEETLNGVAARYPGIDMTPYREAALR